MKKYLETPEEVLALRNTDTKIYCENITAWYCQFIDGVLCRIYTDGTAMFNVYIDLTGNYYILVEEASEKDIGKLCKFWSNDPSQYAIGILSEVHEEDVVCPYAMYGSSYGCRAKHCRRLTPPEVMEITDYKVEE